MNTKINIQGKFPEILNAVVSVLALGAVSVFCYMAGYSLIIPVLLFAIGVHLNFFQKANIRTFLLLGFLLAILLFITHGIQVYTTISHYYIPVAAFIMLTMLLFKDVQLSFVMAFVCSAVVSLILSGGYGMLFIFFIGSLTGAYFVREARTRGRLITAGFFVSVVHLICLVLLTPHEAVLSTKIFLHHIVYPLLANGFISMFFVAATLKIFEFLFGVVTNYSLLELSDFNQPLLKRMILEAPGTYHHSLVVSNLAESAADVIGADSLLSRVGAYYHDIGKIMKPEYFTENQVRDVNRHDFIEPTISRLVIFNHVKEGIELARKNNLNPVIIDFILQHHGTSLMHYFYQRSLEAAHNGEEVNEEEFRYPGPKPQTREAAIVMLADSAEAAVRSLTEASPVRIEETVKKIINNKFIDGQLDECPLTLKEIEKISSTFIRILSAMYHSRVKYPEKSNGSHSPKSSEKTKSQLPADYQERDQDSSA
ncbi:MAG: HDIG domain-containing protein [Candidatus Omnitrophica bacterium]|nr:HDIG domain-containing protein [Candidatus Omnitrophota bacterium]